MHGSIQDYPALHGLCTPQFQEKSLCVLLPAGHLTRTSPLLFCGDHQGGLIRASGGTTQVRLTFTGLTTGSTIQLDDVEVSQVIVGICFSEPVRKLPCFCCTNRLAATTGCCHGNLVLGLSGLNRLMARLHTP
jgi:hypothetical protein